MGCANFHGFLGYFYGISDGRYPYPFYPRVPPPGTVSTFVDKNPFSAYSPMQRKNRVLLFAKLVFLCLIFVSPVKH